jgi:hypothetical protein
MSNDADERELFGRLDEDAGRARLAAPEDLRRRADRRTAARAVGGTVAVVLVVGGLLVGGNALLGNAASAPSPVDTPTASPTVGSSPPPTVSPTVSPTVDPTAAPTVIPASAWLGADDLRGDRQPADDAGLLAPCGRPWLSGAAQESAAVTVSGTMQGNYPAPGVPMDYVPDGTLSQTIVVFGDTQDADQLMQRVQTSIVGCPDDTAANSGDVRYSLADPGLPLSSARPTRHVLVDIDTPGPDFGEGPPDPARVHSYVSVLQVADTVTFLTIQGWEASETDLDDVQRLASVATVRLLDWRS